MNEKEKYTITIGNGEDHAGVFDEETKTIILSIVLTGYIDDKKIKKKDALERVLLMLGCEYIEKTNGEKNIYTLKCKEIKHIERIIPIIEQTYSNYNKDVIVDIDKSCYDFFLK